MSGNSGYAFGGGSTGGGGAATQYTLASDEVAMAAANTQYSWTIPDGTRAFLIKLQDTTVAFRFSFTTGQVAAGGGTPITADGYVAFNEGPYNTGTIYFATGSASMTMRVEYSS